MSKFLKYTVAAALLMLAAACTKDQIGEGDGMACLKLNVSMPGQTRAAAYDALAQSTLRVYKVENGQEQLIRKYTPATDTPGDLYLIAGDYKVTVEAGSKSQATFYEKTYYGEEQLTLTPHQSQIIVVKCKISNIAVRVEFDQTIREKFDQGYVAYVSAADEFSKTEAMNNSVPSLKFDKDSTGFFLLPEDVSNLSWGFYGEGLIPGVMDKTGVIEQPQKGKQYTLTFKYSKTPDGYLTTVVSVRDYEEKIDDNFIFSPQPAVSGNGFGLDEVAGYNNAPIQYKLVSIDAIMTVNVTVNGVTYPVLANGIPVGASAANGITYTPDDAFTGTIEFGAAFFAGLGAGIHDVTFEMRDASGVDGKSVGHVAKAGIIPVDAKSYDLWYNTATLKAIVTDPAISDVAFKFRANGSNWETLRATNSGNYTYTVTINPTWDEQTNEAGKQVYLRTSGIVPGATYEYQLNIGGSDVGTALSFTPTVDQEIPYGNMEDSGLSCFTQSNGNAPYWASGNNSMAKSLCTWSSFAGMSGSGCAKLSATGVMLVEIAAGNLLMGTFAQSGTSGTASFGQPYDWKARPGSLKLKYHATIGNVDATKHASIIPKGQPDKSRIMVMITDWGNRHGVTSGTSKPSGVWDPVNGSDVVSEGKVIGYGSLFITETTSGNSMIEVELPIYYYDTDIKPSKTYTLSISCATSAYGDYMNGCTSNVLYVDDFRWGY